MKLLRKVGVTSEIWQIFVADSSSTTGAGLTGLTNASASLTAYYHRDTDTTATAISLVSMTVGTFTSSGFKEIDATNMPGAYQFCPPNAALASGAKSCIFVLKGATNMAPLPIEVDLDGQVDVTHWNGTAVTAPNTAGTPVVDVGRINNVATTSVTTINANVGQTQPVNFTGTGASALVKCDTVDFAGQTITCAGGVTIPAATLASTTNITAGTITTVTTVTNQLTAAAIATGVWQDATAGDFTTASSIGKALYTGNFAPGAASGLAIVGSAMTLAASQHVIVDSGTVTTLSNLPSIPANWLTAAGIAAAALNGKGDWSTYAGGDTSGTTTLLSRIGSAITITGGKVDVNDKTGFSLVSTGLDLVLVAGKTLPNAVKIIGSTVAGVASGAGTGTEVFQDFSGVASVTVTVDASGNRSVVAYA